MPKLVVEGEGEFEVPAGKRLVLALCEDAGIDQLHACGGNARCTTCRVEFVSGEPTSMRDAEKNCLQARGLSGVRLSCQFSAIRICTSAQSVGSRAADEKMPAALCRQLSIKCLFKHPSRLRRNPATVPKFSAILTIR